ncbi:hypothetical protein [Streptomyces sp. NPDC001536]|uniref:hypothetical protein n=1 Tax=Streptomyces sp. NPDC001536 TaxID=3364583 RepID=UPI003697B1B9
MPRSVGLAVLGVWAQALLGLAVGALLLFVVSDAVGHGRDEGAGLLRFVAVLPVLVTVTLMLCGAWSGKRSNGVRVTVVFFGGLSLLGFSSAEAENWCDR